MGWKYLGLALITVLMLNGCGKATQSTSLPATTAAPSTLPSTTTKPFSSTTPSISTTVETLAPGVLSPGQITEAMINQAVKVQGRISMVNQDPGGLAVIITGGGGQVMLRVENKILDAMTATEKAQYMQGKTITAEGMLVRAPGGELTVVLGITPGVAPQAPKIAEVDIIAGPLKVSNNPSGWRGWPFPRIFVHQGKLAVTYWGVVAGRESNWVAEQVGTTWSPPVEIPSGVPVIAERGAYTLSSLQYTPEKGHEGVLLNVLDDSYHTTKSITVDKLPADHDVDKNTKPAGVVDSNGNLHVIWERNSQTATDIYYSEFDGTRLTEPVSISNSPLLGSVNPSIAIDGNDIVYAFWGQFSEGMYGGDIDIFYSSLVNGKWSVPQDISNTSDWTEFMAVPWYEYAIGPQVNMFYMATKGSEAGPTTHIVLKGGNVISKKQINFGFGDIALVCEGDKINAVFGGMEAVNPDDKWTIKGEVYYNYFDGQDWYAGAGSKILPRDFHDRAEALKLDLTTIGPTQQAKVTLENGGTDLLREIHPYAVGKDGIIHVVFEYNQQGTYDAYYMAFKKKSP